MAAWFPSDIEDAAESPQLDPVIEQLCRGGIVALQLADGTADLVMPGEHATTQNIAFYVRYTSGMIKVALTTDRCDELDLPSMTIPSDDTVSAVPVDATNGVSTGISAADRARTIRVLADPRSDAADLRRPGHVIPLRARPHGVLQRAARPEAAVDLCRMAGKEPVAALAELFGTRADVLRGAAVLDFAAQHGLPLVTINQIIAHRRPLRRAG